MSEITPVRELTYEERAKWGTCPICSAPGSWGMLK